MGNSNECGCGCPLLSDLEVKLLDFLSSINPCMIRDNYNNTNDQLNIVLSEFNFKADADDKWYGEASILEHKEKKELVVLKIIENSSEEEAELIKLAFTRRLQLTHDNILLLRYMVHKSVDALCSVIHKSYLFWDYILTDLSSEIKYRRKQQDSLSFSEEEVWNIAFCLINGMKYLNTLNLNHGCLKTQHVYISQYGEIKIADPGLFNYEPSYEVLFRDRETSAKGLLLSPQELKSISQNLEYPQHDPLKSDVFCAGMILLEVCTFARPQCFYDYYHSLLHEDKLQSYLTQVKEKYNDTVFLLIKEMLGFDECKRPDFKTIFETNMRYNPKFKPSSRNKLYQYCSPHSNATTTLTTATCHLDIGNANNNNLFFNQDQLGIDNRNDTVSVFNMMNQSHVQSNSAVFSAFQRKPYSPLESASVLNSCHNKTYDKESNFDKYTRSSCLDYQFSNSYVSGITSKHGMSNKIFKASRTHEKAVQNYENGSRYEGEVVNGIRDGKGKYYYVNSGYYEGSWKNGQMHGLGVLYFPDGNTAYDGQWVKDMFEGYGRLYNNDISSMSSVDYKDLGERWLKYEGDFKQNKKEGFGTITFSNGEFYTGGFKEDKAHGQGELHTKTREVIKARWNNNKIV